MEGIGGIGVYGERYDLYGLIRRFVRVSGLSGVPGCDVVIKPCWNYDCKRG